MPSVHIVQRLACLALLLAVFVPDVFAQTPMRRAPGTLRPATPPAQADPPTQRNYHRSPPEGTPTAVSGRTAASVDNINDSGRFPIYAIEMGERGDVPCYVKIYYWTGEDRERRSVASGGCTGNPTSRSLQRIGYRDSQVTPNGSLKAVRGLQVCSNGRSGDRYRVKGLRLLAARLTEVDTGDSGTVAVRANSSADASFERPNCQEWEQVRTCPAGQMMTDIDVHYRMDGSRREITGLAPRCATMTFTDTRTDLRDDG